MANDNFSAATVQWRKDEVAKVLVSLGRMPNRVEREALSERLGVKIQQIDVYVKEWYDKVRDSDAVIIKRIQDAVLKKLDSKLNSADDDFSTENLIRMLPYIIPRKSEIRTEDVDGTTYRIVIEVPKVEQPGDGS